MMPRNANSYLETQVLTSPPQKLQLLLVEGAIRFAKKAEAFRGAGDEKAACEALERAQKIVSEIIGGLNQEIDPQLVGQIAAIYIFISQTLSQAYMPENTQAIADAIRVLEQERTTWRMVCEKLAAEGTGQNEAAVLQQIADFDDMPKVDSIEFNATAGQAPPTLDVPFSPMTSTYSPAPLGNSPGFTGISGPDRLAGPTKPSENIATDQPSSGGFSLDA